MNYELIINFCIGNAIVFSLWGVRWMVVFYVAMANLAYIASF